LTTSRTETLSHSFCDIDYTARSNQPAFGHGIDVFRISFARIEAAPVLQQKIAVNQITKS